MGDVRAFSPAEDQIIHERFAAGDRDLQIAVALRQHGEAIRTKDSVRKRRAVLGLLRQLPFGGRKKSDYDTGNYWTNQARADSKFADALRAAGISEGVNRTAGTEHPQFCAAVSGNPGIRSNMDFS